MTSPHVSPLRKVLAAMCSHCPICNYGRTHPDSVLGRLLHHSLHADHCPFWKAEQAVRAESAEQGG